MLALFGICTCSKFQGRVFSNFSNACGKPDTSRQVGVVVVGVNITALNANSSNLARNQNLRITQSDPSRRDSMFQIRANLQIKSI